RSCWQDPGAKARARDTKWPPSGGAALLRLIRRRARRRHALGILKLRLGNLPARRHIVDQPNIPANSATTAQCNAAQYGRARINDNVVLHNRVAWQTFFEFAVGVRGKALCPQGYRLIDTDTLANDGGFANNHAGAMINKEAGPYLGARVYID